MYFPLYGNCSCQLVPLSALAGFFFSFFSFSKKEGTFLKGLRCQQKLFFLKIHSGVILFFCDNRFEKRVQTKKKQTFLTLPPVNIVNKAEVYTKCFTL